MQIITAKVDRILTPNMTLYLIYPYTPAFSKTIPNIKANIIPVIANNVEKAPKIPYLVNYFGATYAIYLGKINVNSPINIPCIVRHINKT